MMPMEQILMTSRPASWSALRLGRAWWKQKPWLRLIDESNDWNGEFVGIYEKWKDTRDDDT